MHELSRFLPTTQPRLMAAATSDRRAAGGREVRKKSSAARPFRDKLGRFTSGDLARACMYIIENTCTGTCRTYEACTYLDIHEQQAERLYRPRPDFDLFTQRMVIWQQTWFRRYKRASKKQSTNFLSLSHTLLS